MTERDTIKVPKPLYSCGLTWFESQKGQNTEIVLKTLNVINFEDFKGRFKIINKELRAEILFYYLKAITKNGICKPPSYKDIGEYFGINKNVIMGLFKELKDSKHIRETTESDKCYKLLKEDFNNENK